MRGRSEAPTIKVHFELVEPETVGAAALAPHLEPRGVGPGSWPAAAFSLQADILAQRPPNSIRCGELAALEGNAKHPT